jgi:hypothetical protein
MREQIYLRIFLAASALSCLVTFWFTRDRIDLMAALLFALVTYTTGQRRSGAFLGAIGAGVAALVIRVHQYTVGVATPSPLLLLNLILPGAVIVFAVLSRRKLPKP